VNLRRLIHHLIHRQGDKVAKHDVNHRAHSSHGGSHTNSGDSRFRNGGVNDTLNPKFIDKTRQNSKGRSGFRYVFANNEDTIITTHFFRKGFIGRLRKCNFTHFSISQHRHADQPRLAGDKERQGQM
jgi:hypothetical protein